MVQMFLNIKDYKIKASLHLIPALSFLCILQISPVQYDLFPCRSLQRSHILYKGCTAFVTWMTHNIFNSPSLMGI